MREYYVLNDDNSVSAIEDVTQWAEAYESRRPVAKTELDPKVLISTVFLGLNHAFDEDGPPMIFETMVFQGNVNDLMCWRYSTWAEAEAGHAKAVALVKDYLANSRPLADLPYSDEAA